MGVYIPLPGSKRTLLPNSRPAGPINSSEIASVTVRVRSAGDPESLAKKAYDLASTPMAERNYLTHGCTVDGGTCGAAESGEEEERGILESVPVLQRGEGRGA